MNISPGRPLQELSNEELGKLFPVIISEPDARWGRIFRNEKIRIRKALGNKNIHSIEHVGSTAVPGLKAKPTIDILLEVPDQTDLDGLVKKLAGIDYQHVQKPENPPPHLMCMKGYSLKGFCGQAFHIHIRYPGDWDELVFRDYLKSHPDIAREYGELKVKLGAQFRNDREGYTEGKSEFVKKITGIARKEVSDKQE